jgi:hypothetical protein
MFQILSRLSTQYRYNDRGCFQRQIHWLACVRTWYMLSSAAMAFICLVFSRRFPWYTLSWSATSGPGCRARMFFSSMYSFSFSWISRSFSTACKQPRRASETSASQGKPQNHLARTTYYSHLYCQQRPAQPIPSRLIARMDHTGARSLPAVCSRAGLESRHVFPPCTTGLGGGSPPLSWR